MPSCRYKPWCKFSVENLLGRQDNGKEMRNQQPHGIGKCKSVMEKPGGLENANTGLDDTLLLMVSALI